MRLAAQAKGGFYPTPPRVTEMIASLMQARSTTRGETTLRILDPCCGAGDALAQLAAGIDRPDGSAVETYGVELHAERAKEAQDRLDHVLGTDLFQTSIANGAFGLLYLNPPYDDDAGEEKRTEHAFLRHCTRYLAELGLLVFVVPRRRLAGSANYLASHYARLRCCAFPDPEREAFDQVVVTGTREAEVQYDQYSAVRLQECMEGNVDEQRSRRRLARGNRHAVVLDGELAVRPLHHLDLRPGVAGPLTPGQQLERAPAIFDGVVTGDAAHVPEDEDGAEVECRVEQAVGRLGLCRRDPEAGVEARQEALEHRLGLGDGGGRGVAEFGHEAVLERPCGPFNTALRLW